MAAEKENERSAKIQRAKWSEVEIKGRETVFQNRSVRGETQV